MNPTAALLVITLVLESALFGVALIWSSLRNIELQLLPTASDALFGFGGGVLLLGAVLLLSETRIRELLPQYEQFTRFREDVVLPLVHSLPQWSFPLVSALAGIGEEFLFRGVLLTESGFFISSALFAVLHFGRASLSFPAVVAVYFVVGIFFALIATYLSLWSAVFAHAFYDLMLLFFLKHRYGEEQRS